MSLIEDLKKKKFVGYNGALGRNSAYAPFETKIT